MVRQERPVGKTEHAVQRTAENLFAGIIHRIFQDFQFMVTLDNRRYVLHVPLDDAMSFFDGLPKNPVTQVFDFVVGNDPKLDVIFFLPGSGL